MVSFDGALSTTAVSKLGLAFVVPQVTASRTFRGSPSACRQALPASGADGEPPLKVVGAARRAGGPS